MHSAVEIVRCKIVINDINKSWTWKSVTHNLRFMFFVMQVLLQHKRTLFIILLWRTLHSFLPT
jgi:hypothetical protein